MLSVVSERDEVTGFEESEDMPGIDDGCGSSATDVHAVRIRSGGLVPVIPEDLSVGESDAESVADFLVVTFDCSDEGAVVPDDGTGLTVSRQRRIPGNILSG